MNMEYNFNKDEFNNFVIAVLRRIAHKSQKTIYFSSLNISNKYFANELNNYVPISYDAFAPYGFFESNSPTFIEIRYNYQPKSNKSIMRVFNKYKNTNSDNEIYIITNNFVDNFDFLSDERIHIFDSNKINEWMREYSIEFINALSTFSKIEQNNIDRVITEEKLQNKNMSNLNMLRDSMDDSNFSLSLGAGISCDHGAKLWGNLIGDITQSLRMKGIIDDFDTVKKKIGDSVLISAQFIKEVHKSPLDYYWEIHQGIYPKSERKMDPRFSIYHVSKICKKYEKNKNFKVITYNYDNYLENYLDYLNVKYNTIFDSECLITENLSIYHIHGYLPKVKFKSHIDSRYQKSIFFTEKDYDLLYNNPYSWQISTQLTIYRENTCLFVGCSITDPSIRRLLKITKKEGKVHYAILTRDNMTIKDVVITSNHFAQMGVEIIWATNVKEIPILLRKLY